MATIEQKLVDLGGDPLKKSPYRSTIIAVVNGRLILKDGITVEMTGSEILEIIYAHPNSTDSKIVREMTLPDKEGDSYKNFLFFVALGVTICFLFFLLSNVLSPSDFDALIE